ncbi:MAG: FAD-binding oxidoreductase [Sphingobacteriaceae bacterium]|nr:FAD-binding oxidoreductase [Sphingobacteriaceae bacterium]
MNKNVNNSYWELKQYFNENDLIVVGGGIVGLTTALQFKLKNKKANVLILERGLFPNGASTKNAGFACFGSATELFDDLSKSDEQTVFETVEMRWKGLQLLLKTLGSKNIRFIACGGYEVFNSLQELHFIEDKLVFLNKKIKETIGLDNTFKKKKLDFFNPKLIKGLVINQHEGQIDTGLMMESLLQLAISNGVKLLNGVDVSKTSDALNGVELQTNVGVFKAKKVVIATNGFVKDLIPLKDVLPARAQVLITKPIKNLKLKGCFHYDKGYYYFRNIDNRILLGGGRNLDFEGETISAFQLNSLIQNKLDEMLKNIIIENIPHEIEHRWCGIMGVGSEKKPIIQFYSNNILLAVRMGGMGVAIGSLVGKIAAEKIAKT